MIIKICGNCKYFTKDEGAHHSGVCSYTDPEHMTWDGKKEQWCKGYEEDGDGRDRDNTGD